jgi:hypothetical protein
MTAETDPRYARLGSEVNAQLEVIVRHGFFPPYDHLRKRSFGSPWLRTMCRWLDGRFASVFRVANYTEVSSPFAFAAIDEWRRTGADVSRSDWLGTFQAGGEL